MAIYPQESSVKISSPFSEQLQFKTLIGSAGVEGKEIRKRKRLYPRRLITLTYETITHTKARTLWAFYIARGGSYEAFTFYYPRLDTYIKEYVGVGDGSTVAFDLPFQDGSDISVYVDNALVNVDDYDVDIDSGTDDCDLLTFDTAPSNGEKITASFTGYLKLRARFAEDVFDFDTFYRALTTTGIKLQGVLNDE